MDAKTQLQQIYDSLVTQQNTLETQLAPVRAEYEAISEQLRPMEARKAELAVQIKDIQGPLVDIIMQVEGLRKALDIKVAQTQEVQTDGITTSGVDVDPQPEIDPMSVPTAPVNFEG